MAKKGATIGIVGLGKYGMSLAEELAKAGRQVVCVDRDEAKVKKALEFTDFAFINSDMSAKAFQDMGLNTCEYLVICFGDHMDVSIFATLSALSLKNVKVLSISNSEELGLVLEKIGADVIYPYQDSVDRLTKRLTSNNILDFIALNDSIEICEVMIPKSYINKAVRDTDIRQKFGLNIVALKHYDNIITRIDPEYLLSADDTMFVLGDKESIKKFEGKR